MDFLCYEYAGIQYIKPKHEKDISLFKHLTGKEQVIDGVFHAEIVPLLWNHKIDKISIVDVKKNVQIKT